MDIMTYTSFRKNLASTLDRVNENHIPIIITRRNGEPAVLMSLEDFKAYDETAYLMASPENKKALDESIAQLESGLGQQHDLIETNEDST